MNHEDGSDTGDLALRGAHAILVGTGSHVPESRLFDLPAVDSTLDDVAGALVDVCGLAPERVHRVPAEADAMAVTDLVERVTLNASGPVLLYYVGHGLLGPGDELYLATRASVSEERVGQAVAYRTVRDLLGNATGGSVVILDCCFSGLASVSADGSARDPFVSARPGGSFLLTSASYYARSFAPEGARHTLFSGELLNLLRAGDPAGPVRLSLDHVHTALERRFRDGPVRPRRQSEGGIGRVALARNAAYRPAAGPETAPPADVPCPYPGMEPFRTEDSAHFHGREDLTDRLLDAVRAPAAGPLVLLGPSGAGKSSLLRAGLLAGLAQRHEAGSALVPWPALLLPAPGERPLYALAALWARATGRPVDEVRQELARGRFPGALPGYRDCRLLVVDQFEEVFTRCQDADERAAFIDVLAGEVSRDSPPGPRVVIGLRADFYGRCLSHPALARALERGPVAVRPMDDDALRAAVEGPARAVGLTLEDGLTDRLLHDLRQGRADDAATPDAALALPFLAHALREIWVRRSGATLTLAGYQATGGIWQSIATTSEELYRSLDPRRRRALRRMLLRMVHITGDGGDVVARRRVRAGALVEGLPDAERSLTEDVRDRLAAARLIIVDRDGAEISHEALLRAWTRLRRWVERDRVGLLLRQQLEDDADAWKAAGRDSSFLYRGSRLAAASALDDPNADGRPLRRVDRAFLRAAREHAERERARDRRQRQSLQRRLRTAVVALCLALVATGVGFQQRNEAQEQRADAQEQRRIATGRALQAEAENLRDSDPRTSLRLSLAALRVNPTEEGREGLTATLQRTHLAGGSSFTSDGVDMSVFSSNGRLLATATPYGDDTAVHLWDTADATRPRHLTAVDAHSLPADSLAFSADQRLLAVVYSAGEEPDEDVEPRAGGVTVWNVADPAAPARLLDLPDLDDPRGAALSPDGTRLAVVAGGARGTLTSWDVSDPDAPRQLHAPVSAFDSDYVEFAPDGNTLVTGSGIVTAESPLTPESITHRTGWTLWDVSEPGRPVEITERRGFGNKATFHPAGSVLAVDYDNTVTLWDVTDPPNAESLATLGHRDTVTDFAFGPDGSHLVTGALDDTATLWDVGDPERSQQVTTLNGHSSPVMSMAFDDDGRGVTLADHDGGLTRWLTTPSAPALGATADTGGRSPNAAAFSPDGTVFAVAGYDGSVLLWDTTEPTAPRALPPLPVGNEAVHAVAFSSDGALLAVGTQAGDIMEHGRVELWDTSDPSAPSRLAVLPQVSGVTALAFSPRAAVLAVAGARFLEPAWVGLWDTGEPAEPAPLTAEDPLAATRDADLNLPSLANTPVVFSPDGTALVLPGSVWDVTDPGEPALLPTERGDYTMPAFSPSQAAFGPDGHLLTSDNSGRLALWSLRPGPRLVSALPSADDDFVIVGYHPDGALAASGGWGGRVTVWDVSDPTLPARAATLTDTVEDVTDVRFSPDGTTLAVTTADGTVEFWDLGSLPAIAADATGHACRLLGTGLTVEEWERYAPGLPYEQTCPG
ncbi:WD-40 repeat-containing protein [Streptomyces zhaozhouensis]|uniref:WD-40 repeat-containing protein n=1 Tax=Streptomyces zhaozhouensis TaxID=1300267 RepID=A0A286DNA6_9ACTN|nr:caspase family protein [Streptomyces zhaozhouensis]SOD60110.1 WD-40 repeat-containing protein [Streptomyces zhaozhouensis]